MKITKYLFVFLIIIFAASFLTRYISRRPATTFEQSGNFENERQICQKLCSNYEKSCDIKNAVEFCENKVIIDIDKNGVKGETGKVGFLNGYPFCEDGIYCFHIQKCSCNNQELNAENCLKILCDYYSEKPQTINYIREKITWGKCKNDDKELQPDWWYEYFGFYSDSCEKIERKKGIISDCYFYDGKITCKTSCQILDRLESFDNTIIKYTTEKTFYGTLIEIKKDNCLVGEKIKIFCKEPEVEKIQELC